MSTVTPEAARLAEEARRRADTARHELLMAIYERHDVAAAFFAFDPLAVGKDRDAARDALCAYDQALNMKIDNLMALSALAKQDAAPTSTSTVPAGSESSGLLKLARYGAAMLHWHRGDNPSECGDVDAITCEEEAVRCGVLEGRNVDEPCCADCICAPFIGWEFCYFMPDDVRAARDKLSAARNPGACSVTDGEAKK